MIVYNKKIELDFQSKGKKKAAADFLTKMKIVEGLSESKQTCIAYI